jgi:hypothetical protein
MGLSKLEEHGMNALGIFLLKMVLGLVKWIPLSSLKSGQRFICMPNIR